MINVRNCFCLGAIRVYSKMNAERRADLCTFKKPSSYQFTMTDQTLLASGESSGMLRHFELINSFGSFERG